MPPNIAGLSTDDRQALDDVVGRFERGWKDGLLSHRAGQIPTDSAWRVQAMAEMVKIDIDRQWRRGRESRVEDYLEAFPELASEADVPAALILAEFEARRQSGAPSDLEGYLRRFPEHANEVARRVAGKTSSAPGHAPSSAGWSAPKPAPDVLPDRLGRYVILKRLGQGGMGSVFLAEDTQLGRKVALKVPHFGPDDGPEARERFFREARTAATLDHPYLCPVFDVGEVDGRLYLTMAFIEGKSLAESLKGEGLPPRQVAALVGKLALALQQAHAKGVVHRDLKPANVMIKSDGNRREPVIVDFGLALRDDGDARMTRSGQVMGTLAYMSPEQVMGDLAAIGPPADIYALGVILYELLTGRLPFNGAGLAIAGQILTQDPLTPSSIRADIDPRIEAICLKAMAKNPEDRYASMADLAASLTGFLKGQAVVATESTPPPTSSHIEPPRTIDGDGLMAEFFQGLATSESEPQVTPNSRSRKPANPSLLIDIGPDEDVEPMLAASGDRPRWLIPAIGGGMLALVLVLAIVLSRFKPKDSHDAQVVKDPPLQPIAMEVKPPPPASEPAKPLPKLEDQPEIAPVAASTFLTPETRPTLLAAYRATSPVLDGVISPGEYDTGVDVDFTEGSRFGAIVDRATKTRDDLSVILHAACTDRSLFLAFRVRDDFIDAQAEDRDRPDRNDAIELFLDGDRTANDFTPSQPPKGDLEGFQIIADTLGNHVTVASFINADWASKARLEPGGYVIEFEIPLKLIDTADGNRVVPASPGSLIHFGMAIDDNDVETEVNQTHAFLRARSDVGKPFYGGESAWSLGIKLGDRPGRPPADAGVWRPIFNGKDIKGWTALDVKGVMANPARVWTVQNGVIHGVGGMSFLYSPRGDYRNFRVRAEVKINDVGNSGLAFRTLQKPGKIGGYQAQINCGHAEPARTGSLYGGKEKPTAIEKSPVPPDTWFVIEAKAVGNQIQTFVDGREMVSWTDPADTFKKGYFAIQSHGTTTHVQLRKLEVMELDDSGNPLAPAKPDEAFRRIFNNTDLAGWKVDGIVAGIWSVENGHIVASGAGPSKKSWLFSDEEYDNFVLRLEAYLPRGTDTGVAIWGAPGEVHPVEVNLRNIADAVAPTGSINTTKAAIPKGYRPPDRAAVMRPEGQWNAVEIESRGGTVTVVVNGRVVHVLKLSDEAKLPNALAATRRGKGRVGFQAHLGTVRFRNVEIKRL